MIREIHGFVSRFDLRRALGDWRLVLLIYCLPVIGSAAYVAAFAVDMPWVDQFNFIPLLESSLAEALFSADSFAQHNEHRIYFPRLAMLILARATGYDVVVEMYFTQALLLVGLGVLLLVLKRQFKPGALVWLWLSPVPFLLFSLRQHQNFLFGFQLSQVSVLVCSVVSLYAVTRCPASGGGPGWRYAPLALAASSAVVASLSSAGGLLVWPIACLLFLLLPLDKGSKRACLACWSLIGVAVWLAYFHGYQRPSHHPDMSFALESPLVAIEYLFVFIGGALSWQRDVALIIGLALPVVSLSSLVLVYRAGRLDENAFWIALMGLGYLTALVAPISRSGFGVEQALESKYSTFSIPIVVAQYVLLLDLVLSRAARELALLKLGVLLGLIGVGLFTSSIEAIEYGKNEKARRERLTPALREYRAYPDQLLSQIHPNSALVRRGAGVLDRLGYSVFRADVPSVDSDLPTRELGTKFWLDLVNENLVGFGIVGDELREPSEPLVIDPSAGFVRAAGWAVDLSKEDVAGDVYLRIGDRSYRGYYGVDRRDIAEMLANSSYRYTGFELIVPISDLEPGLQEWTFLVLSSDRRLYYSFAHEFEVVFSDGRGPG